MSVRVWSPHAGIPVRLKVEEHANANHSVETEATVTIANGWQTLEFNFANQVAGTAAIDLTYAYDKASIFFNFGTTGATAGERTYYFDDVKFISGGGINLPPQLPLTFQSANTSYAFTDFDGGATTVIDNPFAGGINNSTRVAKMVKSAGQTWGGSLITLNEPIDFSVKKLFKMKVYGRRAGIKVLLKVENATDASINFEKQVVTAVANQWEELSFDFSDINISNSYQKLVFIFDNGTMGNGTANFTYYFDDVELTYSTTGTPKSQMELPLTFDDDMVDYSLIGFEGAEQSSIVTDPTLATNKVAKVIKSATANLAAGTHIATSDGLGFKNAVPFTIYTTKMSVRVWSPDAGVKVRIKLADHADDEKYVVAEAFTTLANEWQTMEFDFSKPISLTPALDLNNSYDKATIYFNYGVNGTTIGERTYYFDDLKFIQNQPAVEPDAVLKNLVIYPKAFAQFVNIKNETTAPLQINIFNSMGNKVKTALSSTPLIHIDLSNLANGFYILQVQNRLNNKTLNQTIIKQ
jgi:hypothetical protein